MLQLESNAELRNFAISCLLRSIGFFETNIEFRSSRVSASPNGQAGGSRIALNTLKLPPQPITMHQAPHSSGLHPKAPPSIPPSWAVSTNFWHGFPMTLEPMPEQATASNLWTPEPVLAVALSGNGVRRYHYGTHQRDLYTSPGMVELYSPGHELKHGFWRGQPGTAITIRFPEQQITRLLHAPSRALSATTQHETFNPALVKLVSLMWEAAASTDRQEPLYVQGLTLALIGLMEAQFAPNEKSLSQTEKFTARQSAQIRDYIQQELGSPLTIDGLANLVNMSAHRFSHMFRRTFDMTPYAYVLQLRLQVASQLLQLQANLPIADIALSCGFSNQAHFTEAFRKKFGLPPAKWRKEMN